MSGGIAYIYDERNMLEKRINKEMIEIDNLNLKYENEIKKFLEKHFKYTESETAKLILDKWDIEKNKFKVVVSPKYKELFLNGEVE